MKGKISLQFIQTSVYPSFMQYNLLHIYIPNGETVNSSNPAYHGIRDIHNLVYVQKFYSIFFYYWSVRGLRRGIA